MFLAGSWIPADTGLMVVFGVAVTAIVAIGVHVVRSSWTERGQ
jgi:hypothetical protein